ncbi:hypothetical protein pEaSNUABM5_00340 [Erwinia phage pEa_SNUABM_5]|uniref:Uncharacterized protein n=1 Tax=Erwinia phage pEa_SNUABM_5 TaxID=2797313 RepID=A0A7T8IW76_9CAUD|nr:hypothetical protein MPK73_gp340 [Erwinia phage pEa_SNUABM_5]QQO90482.1 hypothetical protein pEaSNUABM5_00340 [Erwinia phage pEa_SNUABM_5]
MSDNFRSVVSLQFSHAASLARALKTLKNHCVFGGLEVTESNARDIGTSFLSEILEGKCPIVDASITSIDGLAHRRDKVTFDEGESACIEAFNTIIMEHSARVTLRRELSKFRLETNKDVNDLLWKDDAGTKQAIELSPHHGLSCDCETCEDMKDD